MTDQLKTFKDSFSRRVYHGCKLEHKHDYPDRLVHLKLEGIELFPLYNGLLYINSPV